MPCEYASKFHQSYAISRRTFRKRTHMRATTAAMERTEPTETASVRFNTCGADRTSSGDAIGLFCGSSLFSTLPVQGHLTPSRQACAYQGESFAQSAKFVPGDSRSLQPAGATMAALAPNVRSRFFTMSYLDCTGGLRAAYLCTVAAMASPMMYAEGTILSDYNPFGSEKSGVHIYGASVSSSYFQGGYGIGLRAITPATATGAV